MIGCRTYRVPIPRNVFRTRPKGGLPRVLHACVVYCIPRSWRRSVECRRRISRRYGTDEMIVCLRWFGNPSGFWLFQDSQAPRKESKIKPLNNDVMFGKRYGTRNLIGPSKTQANHGTCKCNNTFQLLILNIKTGSNSIKGHYYLDSSFSFPFFKLGCRLTASCRNQIYFSEVKRMGTNHCITSPTFPPEYIVNWSRNYFCYWKNFLPRSHQQDTETAKRPRVLLTPSKASYISFLEH